MREVVASLKTPRRRASLRRGPAGTALMLLEGIRYLRAKQVDVALVRSTDQPVRGGIARVLVDVRILDPDVRVSDIDGPIR